MHKVLDAAWEILLREQRLPPSREARSACRDVFNRIPEILGTLLDEIADGETVRDARLRIALDLASVDILRAAGMRFAEPKHDSFPFSLAVNGSASQREAALLAGRNELTVRGVLHAFPTLLVEFAAIP